MANSKKYYDLVKTIPHMTHKPFGYEYEPNVDNQDWAFWMWAASWDCKEAETDGQDSPMIGDEIEVGTLWEDKSQKDFKSYL